MWKVAVFVLVVGAGCVAQSSVTCPSGRTCPTGTTCDDVRDYCLTQAQATACNGVADGKQCDAAGTPGICDRGLCEPGCGDGHTDEGEHCDDGNFANHDGCSSSCEEEIATWIEQEPEWIGLSQQSVAYDDALGRTLMIGGLDRHGLSDRIWQYNPSKRDTPSGGWKNITAAFAPTERPTPRSGAVLAYDSARGVLVYFGGGDQSNNFVNDTWEYVNMGATFDGEPIGTWRPVPAPTAPSPRYGAAMAFDPSLRKMVLFGGTGFPNPPPDTWLFDGTTWASVVTTVKPNTFYRASMAFDVTRNKLVMFGSTAITTHTYEFTGTDWTAATLTPSPSPRRGAVMAYDANRSKLVLFGGQLAGVSQDVAQDTWTYDGTWQQLGGAEAPPARRTAAMASDPVNHLLVVTGGSVSDAAAPFDDLWELDATGWTQHTPRFGPIKMLSPAGAYSVDQHVVIIVGGASNETWRNDGTKWIQDADVMNGPTEMALVYASDQHRFLMAGGDCNDDSVACSSSLVTLDPLFAFDPASHTWSSTPASWDPTARRTDFSFAYDDAAHHAVAFGGYSYFGPPQETLRPADTWITDAMTWTQVAGVQPAATSRAASAFDPGRGTVILLDDKGVTWELRDDVWTQLEIVGDSPPGRHDGAMVYNPVRKRLTLVGGYDMHNVDLDDVWELDSAKLEWNQVFIGGAGPLPRHKFALVMQPNARSVMLFGGGGGLLFGLNDTWALKYVSSTPDENCTDGIDNDGDGQVDGDDVDCNVEP